MVIQEGGQTCRRMAHRKFPPCLVVGVAGHVAACIDQTVQLADRVKVVVYRHNFLSVRLVPFRPHRLAGTVGVGVRDVVVRSHDGRLHPAVLDGIGHLRDARRTRIVARKGLRQRAVDGTEEGLPA